MNSLGTRLALFVALVALLLACVATVAVAVQQYQDDNSWLASDIELAAFQAAASQQPQPPTQVRGGDDPFVALFDAEGRLTQSSTSLTVEQEDNLYNIAIDTEPQAVVLDQFDDGAGNTVVVGATTCESANVCDLLIVGATETRPGSFVWQRLLWILLFPLAATAAAFAITRAIVGWSLRPVEKMRGELDAITATDLNRRVPVDEASSELQALGTSMNHTIDRLSNAVSANQRFVADAAHELRSPIAGVRAAVEIEAANHSSDLLAGSLNELDRASRLVDDLLLLARHQGSTTIRADVDLDDIVRSVVGTARTRHEDVSFELALQPSRLQGDHDAITQLVTNLIDNAVVYGGGQIRASTHVDEDTVVLHIEDNGLGIPVEQRSTIFDRFARLDDSRARDSGGSGLGLAIVAELAQAHGGSVTIGESDLGGAHFEIVLPAQQVPVA